LILQGKALPEIAAIRRYQLGSVVELVAAMVESGEIGLRPGWVDAGKYTEIEKACTRHGTKRLKPLKDVLPPDITFAEIRLVVARLRYERAKHGTATTP
jgi:uncharacterized protein YpbB